jgi:hypothetical protein
MGCFETAVLGCKFRKLNLEITCMFFFSFSECTLSCSILCSSTLKLRLMLGRRIKITIGTYSARCMCLLRCGVRHWHCNGRSWAVQRCLICRAKVAWGEWHWKVKAEVVWNWAERRLIERGCVYLKFRHCLSEECCVSNRRSGTASEEHQDLRVKHSYLSLMKYQRRNRKHDHRQDNLRWAASIQDD